MIDLKSRPISLVSNFEELRSVLGALGPESLDDVRFRAFNRFREVGIPTQKDEDFKYLPLRVLEDTPYKPAYGATVDRAQLSKTPLGDLDAITVAFINGQYAPELSSADSLPAGAFVGTLADALEQDEVTVLSSLGTVASLEGRLGKNNDERFVHLNTAYLGEGAYVRLEKGVELERPIHLLWISTAEHGPFAAFPRSLAVLERGARARIIESFIGLSGTYFNDAVSEIVLAEDSALEHTKFQYETETAVHIANVSVRQEATSTYTSNNLNFGGKTVRNDINVWLGGEHTETWLDGAAVGLGEQLIDNHTRIDHAMPNCHSFETYKTILGDRAHGVFNGKIFVYQDAQKTDAKQTNQAILLSKTAEFDTKPQLEIFADDVKCTHGATVGQLRDDALFYMRARGVPMKQAQALLVYAFAAEVLGKVTFEPAREAIEKVLFEKLNTGGQVEAE